MSNHHSTGSPSQRRLRHLPDAISLARLGAVPVLLWLAVIGREEIFTGLLLLALASDLVDGWLARRLGVVSARGALLDSMGDMALTVAILWGIWWLHAEVFKLDGWIIYSLLIAWLLAHTASLLRYGRLASYHTWLIRIGIAAFNFFAVILFLLGYHPWLLYFSAALSLLGVVEHFMLLWRLPEWTPNIPGGIFRIWRNR
jgi:CDP-diacylglycerol--glycerol-3-phosphate 3-phosphatidyltransferase